MPNPKRRVQKLGRFFKIKKEKPLQGKRYLSWKQRRGEIGELKLVPKILELPLIALKSRIQKMNIGGPLGETRRKFEITDSTPVRKGKNQEVGTAPVASSTESKRQT